MADGKVQDDQDQQDPQGGQQEGAQAQGQGEGTPQVLGTDGKGADAPAPDYERQLAERDQKIKELEAKVAEASKTAEAAERLRGEIADLRKASEDERLDFSLKLAGCRNVKAARAVLADYKGDVDALKAGEPWLFSKDGATSQAATGSTGLPSAGASGGSGDLKRWERLAGLTKEE
jgi:hypothetical protein